MPEPGSLYLALYSRSLCCHVRTTATVIGVYYLAFTLVVCADMVTSLIRGKDVVGFLHSEQLPHGQKIFDIVSNFLLLAVMVFSSVCALIGLRKRTAQHLVPLTVLLILDVGLTVLSFFSGPWGLPGTLTFDGSETLLKKLRQSKELDPRTLTRFTLAFVVLFILYLLMKVFMMKTFLHCYFVLKAEYETLAQKSNKAEKSVSVDLPSYDEALKLPSKPVPPAIQNP